MKKIMFNDKYGLTEAVLSGRKTMTRRLAKNISPERPIYFTGEIIAIAQSYNKALPSFDWCNRGKYKDEAGWTNKMFVRADLMPYGIKMVRSSLQKLQEISYKDCIKEGIISQFRPQSMQTYFYYSKDEERFSTPREAFAALIDKLGRKGTWDNDPWVWAYEFELMILR